MATFMGVDPTSTEKKASGCAVLASDGKLLSLLAIKTDAEILELVERHKPDIIGIDSPLGFPKGMCCLEASCSCESVHEFKGRRCERLMSAQGISLYYTTKRTFIKAMIYRSIKLKEKMESMGSHVIEVYPYGSKVRLFGKPIPKKTKKVGLEFLHTKLSKLVPGLSEYEGKPNHDMYDGLVAAYTAYLYGLGQCELIGTEDEVQIVLPKAS